MPNLFTQPLNYLLLVFLVFAFSCKKSEAPDTNKFSLEDTSNLGDNIKSAIEARSNEFELLDSKRFPAVYQFINLTLAEILNTSQITYTDEFDWSVTLIDNDSIATSFVLPGGLVYITTGLLKTHITSKAEFFSVLAHEMVYADNRYVLKSLETKYSPSSLLDISLGNNPDEANEIVDFLMSTPYDTQSIFDADEKTCSILCGSGYRGTSFTDFMDRLFKDNTMIGWTLLHPDSGFRITNVNGKLIQLGCSGSVEDNVSYEDFVSHLP